MNSAKSANPPAKDYLDPFVVIQHSGLTITHQDMTAKIWSEYTQPYISELRVTDRDDLLNLEKLRSA